ncbi:MAG: thiamine diphosphokinase [Candidatus Coproplasma sp.]
MKGILLLNGEPYLEEIDASNAFVTCCDGAYEWANGRIRIDENVGDFDSLPYIPTPPPTEIYPSEKDFTDGEIALRKLIARGVNEVEIYGAGGGREDHFLGNLQLLYYAHKQGVKARIITKNSIIFPASGKIEIDGIKGKTFSVLPFGGKVHIMYGRGFKYDYPESLSYGECRGISNIGIEESGVIEIGEDETALIIINRGKV